MVNAFLRAIDKHVIAESTNLGGTNYAKHIFNVVASEDIDNGKLVNLTDMQYYKNATANGLIVSGGVKNSPVLGNDKFANGEAFTMVEPTSTSRVGLIISVPESYDTTPFAATLESNFYNGKGEVMRVYDLLEGDKFTVSENGITALSKTPVVGNYVVADGYDIAEVAKGESAPVGAFYGEIIEKINRTGGTFYKIFVRKNG